MGEAFSQGLSEQLPKEMQRMRLAEGLKSLKGMQGTDQFDMISKAMTTPGMTPEAFNTMLPVLQNLIQSRAIAAQNERAKQGDPNSQQYQNPDVKIRVVGGQQGPRQNVQQGQPGEEILQPNQPRQVLPPTNEASDSVEYPSTLTTPEVAKIRSPRPTMGELEKLQKSNELFTSGMFPSIDSALKYVNNDLLDKQAEYDESLKVDERKIAVVDGAKKTLTDTLFKNLQSSSIAEANKEVPQELITNAEYRLQNAINDGKNPDTYAKKESDKLFEFAKARDKFKLPTYGKYVSPKTWAKDMRDSKNPYARLGDPKAKGIHVDDLVKSHGFSKTQASEIAMPLSAGLKKAMDGIENKVGFVYGLEGVPMSRGVDSKKIDKIIEAISKNMTKEDSYQTILSELNNKGFKESGKLAQALREAYSQEKIPSYNERQKRELDTLEPYSTPTLTDLLYRFFK